MWRERESEREKESVCLRQRDKESVCLRQREREREGECVCVWERERNDRWQVTKSISHKAFHTKHFTKSMTQKALPKVKSWIAEIRWANLKMFSFNPLSWTLLPPNMRNEYLQHCINTTAYSIFKHPQHLNHSGIPQYIYNRNISII